MSEKPLAAAREAAPILKLWLLYLVGSSLQNWSAFCNSVVKNSLATADPSVCTNNGPGCDPLTAIYSLSRRTGHIAVFSLCTSNLLDWKGELCLKFHIVILTVSIFESSRFPRNES